MNNERWSIEGDTFYWRTPVGVFRITESPCKVIDGETNYALHTGNCVVLLASHEREAAIAEAEKMLVVKLAEAVDYVRVMTREVVNPK